MIVPNSIPAWYSIIQKARDHQLEININVDPFSGKQTGHMFLEEKGYPFSLELYSNNLILSTKFYSEKLFSIWSELLEVPFRISYQANTDFPFHAEWYFDCEEELILQEIEKMKRSINLKILHINEHK